MCVSCCFMESMSSCFFASIPSMFSCNMLMLCARCVLFAGAWGRDGGEGGVGQMVVERVGEVDNVGWMGKKGRGG